MAAPTASSAPPPPVPNTEPTPSNPYWKNLILARILRYLGPIGFFWHNYFLHPRAQKRSYKVYIDSRLSKQYGGRNKIRLDVYLPPGVARSSPAPSPSSPASPSSSTSNKGTAHLHTGIINFHGGGFTIGDSTDDARFARFCTDPKYLDAVFISVQYRLAPEYPFPTPVEDCADAIRYVYDHAEEFGVDKERILLSGFSAGGNLAVAGSILVNHPEEVGYGAGGINANKARSPIPTSIPIRGILAFYPLLEYVTSRLSKFTQHPDPPSLRPLPTWMVNLFDTSYLPNLNPDDKRHPLISPSLAPDELLVDFPPIHLVVCERDVLLPEAEVFGARLRKLKADVGWTSSTKSGASSGSESGSSIGTQTRTRTRTRSGAGTASQPTSMRAQAEELGLPLGPGQPTSDISEVLPEPDYARIASIRVVKDAAHGWDKPMHPVGKSVIDEYEEAMRVGKAWLEE